jgi:hypothetical protein
MCVLTRPCGRPPSNCSRPKGLPWRVGWPSAEPPFLLSLQAGPNSSENDREWNFLATARVPCLDPILPRATGCYWATLLESHPSSAKSDWWMRVPCMDRHSVMTSTKRAVPCGFRGERTKNRMVWRTGAAATHCFAELGACEIWSMLHAASHQDPHRV